MSKHTVLTINDDGLILSGYQKKLKTMKKKFFVLYKETSNNVARLEYYDNERKFKSGLSPKRIIKIKHCFNINQRFDTKYAYVIALSTKDGGFGIVLETETDMRKWLDVLISLQRNDGNSPFEHVWQVIVQKKGLAEDKGILGNYHVCLTQTAVTFIRIGPEKTTGGQIRKSNVEIILTTIRRCGDSHCFFYMEVGRQSAIGPGELWLETEDSLTAQNMHSMISSAMSVKIEPMRPRSSSATEASKLKTTLQRRQTQFENKSNNALQTNLYFARERCDSLPSRNRSSSESSNHSFAVTSAQAIRTAGPLSNSHQRHSSSPPISSNFGCSESEESSVSIDEADDNGGFIPFRFNSRSAEGVILEENTDEISNSDKRINLDMDEDHAEQTYMSMAPLKTNNTLNEVSKLNFKVKSVVDDTVSTHNEGINKSEIKFSEYSSANIVGNCAYEIDSQLDRPARTYSIGSKVEHMQNNKRTGNLIEPDQNSTRVRAFSVGSRVKIPRCDLQHGILLPKSMIEQNFNSNNNIFTVTDISTHQLLNISAYREKKSTSAPLLIQKSLNSVDHMGDLMEIDFSKNIKNSCLYPFTSTRTFKRTGCTIRNPITNLEAESITNAVCKEETLYDIRTKISEQQGTEIDNGYLEMKPVGNVFFESSSSLHSDLENKSMSFDSNDTGNQNITKSQQTVLNDGSVASTMISTDCNLEQENIIQKRTCNPKISKEKNFKSINFQHEKEAKQTTNSIKCIASKYAQLNVNCATNNICFDAKSEDDNINIMDGFLRPRTEDDGNIPETLNDKKKIYYDNVKLSQCCNHDKKTKIYNTAKKIVLSNDLGYEILHNKSDILLKCNKPLSVVRKDTQQSPSNQKRPKSTNNASLLSNQSSQTFYSCPVSSTSVSCLNIMPTKSSQKSFCQTKDAKDLNCFEIMQNGTETKSKFSLRPPSLSCDHKLYYASLDLPQCTKDTPKESKTENVNDLSPIVLTSENNAYAKIDFDHSDSSSSSSRNFNV